MGASVEFVRMRGSILQNGMNRSGVLLCHFENVFVGLGEIDLRTDDGQQHSPLDPDLVVPLNQLLRSAELAHKGRRLSICVGMNVNEHFRFTVG